MATKSILKNIHIDKTNAEQFAAALTSSETARSKPINHSKNCIQLKGNAVKDFLNK